MVRRSHQGRPGTPVIPVGWAAAHRPVVTKTLQGTCSIRHPGGTPGTFNPETLEYEGGSANAAHFTGPCSLEDLPALVKQTLVAEEQVPTVGYLVTLDWDDAPDTMVDDIVTIGAAGPNGDPSLTGKQLTVRAIERGTRSWSRALLCTENQS